MTFFARARLRRLQSTVHARATKALFLDVLMANNAGLIHADLLVAVTFHAPVDSLKFRDTDVTWMKVARRSPLLRLPPGNQHDHSERKTTNKHAKNFVSRAPMFFVFGIHGVTSPGHRAEPSQIGITQRHVNMD